MQKFVRSLIIKFESHLTIFNHLEISLSLTSKLVTKHGTYVHLNLLDYLEMNIKASSLILRLIPMRLYVTILLNVQDKALLCATWSNVEEPTSIDANVQERQILPWLLCLELKPTHSSKLKNVDVVDTSRRRRQRRFGSCIDSHQVLMHHKLYSIIVRLVWMDLEYLIAVNLLQRWPILIPVKLYIFINWFLLINKLSLNYFNLSWLSKFKLLTIYSLQCR